ncbi:methyltransferase family protein [Tamaricihabitans halophyticus]|uniref:Methyltransferase family protein n=1 Tax=Tamaricihabitans halophyticus TaxID=1262583 RepID=A0A4R2R3G8_9PSEU|nr:class I SAM-dependent methyltransferase [Tamaricihabitans halophyticus]TCP56404.1 methyltransferase family protein [Tamaricihabitans halophyticus]
MTEQESTQFAVDPHDVDFDAFYRGTAPIAGQDLSFDTIPWDIGEAQPRIVELVRTGQLTGPVLDIGCGLGDNTLFLRQEGFDTLGVDGSAAALDMARKRASDQELAADFVQADATTLDGVPQRFNTVLDSALYHCLSTEQRIAYAAALHRVTLPGARLHLYCFADAVPDVIAGIAPVSKRDLEANLGTYWRPRAYELTSYTTAFTLDSLPQQATPVLSLNPEHAGIDEQERLLFPVWHLHAERR